MSSTIITIQNDNSFDAGWHACHLGLPKDCITFESPEAQHAFDIGFKTRQETADMEDGRDASGHGNAHIAFLMQATNEFPSITWARSKVSISESLIDPNIERILDKIPSAYSFGGAGQAYSILTDLVLAKRAFLRASRREAADSVPSGDNVFSKGKLETISQLLSERDSADSVQGGNASGAAQVSQDSSAAPASVVSIPESEIREREDLGEKEADVNAGGPPMTELLEDEFVTTEPEVSIPLSTLLELHRELDDRYDGEGPQWVGEWLNRIEKLLPDGPQSRSLFHD